MKVLIRNSSVALLVVLIEMQFFPVRHNDPQPADENDFLLYYRAPRNISNLIKAACYDCHSNQTKYPWYSRVQPVGWFLQHHIKDGKEEVNLSEFGALSSRMKRMKLKSITKEVEKGKMPLKTYQLLHPDAKLSASEREQISQFINSQIE